MKKKFFIVLINIILTVFVYFSFKYISMIILMSPQYNGLEVINAANYFMKLRSYEDFYKYHYRPEEYPDSKEKPIIILGCSFAQGLSSVKPLNGNETISYLLAQKFQTKRPVYNRALGSTGIQAMIWQFSSGEIYKIINKEPELIIYVLIDDTMRRLYMEWNPWFKSAFYREKKDGSLELIKNPIYYSYVAALIRNFLEYPIYRERITDDQKFDFLRKHFLLLKNEVNKKYKNTKFLILYYPRADYQNERIKTLENDGFDVIYVSDITPNNFLNEAKYRDSETDPHPTKEAWEVITPRLYDEISRRYNIK